MSTVAPNVPTLPVELTTDFLWALNRTSDKFGGRLMSQEALKVYQAVPLVWAALCFKDGGSVMSEERGRRTTAIYMDHAMPAFVALLKSSGAKLPLDFEEKMRQTTLGTGMYVLLCLHLWA